MKPSRKLGAKFPDPPFDTFHVMAHPFSGSVGQPDGATEVFQLRGQLVQFLPLRLLVTGSPRLFALRHDLG